MIVGPGAAQAPFLEYDTVNRRWRIWQSFTHDVRSGTYIDLYPDGQADRVTTLNGDVMNIVTFNLPLQDL